MTKLALSAIFAGVLFTFSAPAFAQQTKDDPTTVEAKARFGEGIKFADQGDHEQARLKFGQAWALLKSPAILYNLARSEQLSNHPVEALEHYRMFLKMGSDPKVTEQQKQRAAENQAELTKKVGQIEVAAPAGAKITIDGKAVEWEPNADPFPVLPGKHVVESSADGKTKSATIDCNAGTVTKATLTEPAAPPPATPPAPPPTVTEPPKEQAPGFWTTGREVGLGIAALGVASAVVGVVFQLKSGTDSNDADALKAKLPDQKSGCSKPIATDLTQTCSDLSTKNSAVSSDQNLRTVFFAAGGALLVGGVVLFLVSSPTTSEPTRGFRFMPYASADGGGLTAFGRF